MTHFFNCVKTIHHPLIEDGRLLLVLIKIKHILQYALFFGLLNTNVFVALRNQSA